MASSVQTKTVRVGRMERKIVSRIEMNMRRALKLSASADAIRSGAVGALAMEMALTDEARADRDEWMKRTAQMLKL